MKRSCIISMMIAVFVFIGLMTLTEVQADAASYVPIRGVRKITKNKEAIARKKKLNRKIKNTKKKLSSAKEYTEKLKKELSDYQRLSQLTDVFGNIILTDEQSYRILNSVTDFDGYFKNMLNRNEEDKNLISLNRQTASLNSSDISTLNTLGFNQKETVVTLQVNGAETVDMNVYISNMIQQKQQKIQKIEKQMQAAQKKIHGWKKKAKKIVTANIVFNSSNVTELSHISKKQMRKILKGTKLARYADVYVNIEKKYGINAVAFCSISALESGWGESRRAKYDHNYTGFGVYSDHARGINASSGEKNLYMTAKHLAKCYLHKGDQYYHGKSLLGLNKSYSGACGWAREVEDIGIRLMNRF